MFLEFLSGMCAVYIIASCPYQYYTDISTSITGNRGQQCNEQCLKLNVYHPSVLHKFITSCLGVVLADSIQ